MTAEIATLSIDYCKSLVDTKFWTPKILQIPEQPYFYLVVEHRLTKEIKVFAVENSPDAQSLYRLKKRILYNYKKFNYFVTLTFPDKNNGYYKNGLEYSNKHTLMDIKFKFTFPGYMRKFFNRIQQYSRRYKIIKFSYFWKYEQGEQTNRPHIHCLIGFHPMNLKFFKNLDNQQVPLILYKMFMKSWNSGWIDISPITSKQVDDYLTKYFTKKNTVNRRNGVRRWSCSRDIVKPPKSWWDLRYKSFFMDDVQMFLTEV